MKSMFGGLLAAGWTLETVLDLTVDQLSFSAECVIKHKMDMLEMVLEPVLTGLGSKYKKGRVRTPPKRDRKSGQKSDKDARLLSSISMAGLPVETQGG